RSPLSVGSRPHVVASLGRDDQLVAAGPQVLADDAAAVRLRRPVRRAVVVRQVEVGDAQVERAAQDGPAVLQRAVVAEVVPQPQRHLGKLDAAAPAATVADLLVAVSRGGVGHAPDFVTALPAGRPGRAGSAAAGGWWPAGPPPGRRRGPRLCRLPSPAGAGGPPAAGGPRRSAGRPPGSRAGRARPAGPGPWRQRRRGSAPPRGCPRSASAARTAR